MKKNFDLTEGPIVSRLLLVALPIMGTQLFQMLYNLIDMFLVARISSDAVAATGSAWMFTWFSGAFMVVGSMGAEIGVSQQLGKKNPTLARIYSQNAVLIAGALGLLVGAAMFFFSEPFIRFLQVQEENVIRYASGYLSILALGMPLNFIAMALIGTFNGAGNARFGFLVKSLGLLVNVILSPLFIFTFSWGIAGAAWATALSQSLVGIVLLLAMKFERVRPFEGFAYADMLKSHGQTRRQIFKWTLPIWLESVIFPFFTMFIARFVSSFGADAIAAQRIGTQIEALSWMVGGGFAAALTSYVGQNFGAHQWGRIHRGFKAAFWMMFIYGLAITALLYFGAKTLFLLFIDDPVIVAIGVDLLRIYAKVQLVECLGSLGIGAFRGFGKTKPASWINSTFNIARVPLAYLMSQTDLGLNGIWWAIVICNSLRGLILLVWYGLFIRNAPKKDIVLPTKQPPQAI